MVNWYPVNQDQIDKGRVFNQEKEREGGREGERETETERERERERQRERERDRERDCGEWTSGGVDFLVDVGCCFALLAQ